jgi:hypothetical protein
LHFSSSLDRFGHLPVPSEIFGWRGKKDFKIVAEKNGARRGADADGGTRLGEKSKRRIWSKSLPKPEGLSKLGNPRIHTDPRAARGMVEVLDSRTNPRLLRDYHAILEQRLKFLNA